MIGRIGLVLCTWLSLSASLAAQSLPTAEPDEVGLSSERLQRIDEAFQTFVDEGRIAGAVGMILRHGKIAYTRAWGSRDLAAGDPMEIEDIFRIASMTKPVTSVAVMILFEEGRFFLDAPIGQYLPELAELSVARLSDATSPEGIPTEPARRPVTIHDLLRHTSGLTYGSFSNTVVDQLYRQRRVTDQPTLEDMISELGEVPLLWQPGTRWHYSVSTDVLGRLVEVVSGQALDVFFRERIFEPLGMVDTGFHVPASELDRLTRQYGHEGPDRRLQVRDTLGFLEPPMRLSGGGGLVSTARDYARFSQMLLNGGELHGARILSPKTVEMMTVDHLGDIASQASARGLGFGLGFRVKTEPGLDGMPDSVGSYYWRGIRGTSFWIDPSEELVGILMIQIRPNLDVRFRDRFKSLVYQAIVR